MHLEYHGFAVCGDILTAHCGGSTDDPRGVDCSDCLRRMVRWNGRQSGLPSWTSYRVDAMTEPGKIIVIGENRNVSGRPGDWLIDLGKGIAIIKGKE